MSNRNGWIAACAAMTDAGGMELASGTCRVKLLHNLNTGQDGFPITCLTSFQREEHPYSAAAGLVFSAHFGDEALYFHSIFLSEFPGNLAALHQFKQMFVHGLHCGGCA